MISYYRYNLHLQEQLQDKRETEERKQQEILLP